MYGMPQPNTYGQYGFGAYATTPGAAPGMPAPAGSAAGGSMAMTVAGQAGAADPNAAAAAAGQAGQGQWSGADASSYYSNYWGGESFCQPSYQLC